MLMAALDEFPVEFTTFILVFYMGNYRSKLFTEWVIMLLLNSSDAGNERPWKATDVGFYKYR